MQTIRKQLIGENLIYFFVWSAIILSPILASKMLGEEHVNLGNILISWRKISPYLLLFLVNNLYMAPKLLLRQHYIYYVISSVVVVLIIFGAVDIYERYLVREIPDIELMVANRKASFTDLALPWNVLLGLFMVATNSMIKLMYHTMRNEQEMAMLRQENMQAEIDYLKYQINPHFFMNTLNNIHALIEIDSEAAQSAVIELSKMMRYVLYKSDEKSISLEQDMQFIENYVKLMQMRYAEELDIRIEYPRERAAQLSIPPLLLVVFVENAFKHGVSSSRPSFIHIGIEEIGENLHCTVVNSRSKRDDNHKPGIGLQNVTKRMELIYGDKFELRRREEEDAYIVELKIPKNNDY